MTAKEWLGEENTLGLEIFNGKYRKNGETFDEWLDRVSSGNHDLKQLIREKKFLFAGRILANLNTGSSQGISNCVTRGYVEDSLIDIMKAVTDLAFSFKSEAGVGICLSKIRPKGAKIGVGGVSDGVMGFAKIYNEVTANISRGNARRGALLLGLHCDHPDVLDFIKSKKDNVGVEGNLTSANLSVLITDEFMEHYQKRESYRKDFTVESTGEVIEHTVDTVMIMNAIVDEPSKAFDPAMLFVDRYRDGHLFGNLPHYNELFNNACSEYIGMKHTTCLLGSMNVAEFVDEKGMLDVSELIRAVRVAIRGLDDVHDYGMTRNGLVEQNEMARKYRSIGLGVMGFADMLIKMGIKYGSEASINIARSVGEIMRATAIGESRRIANEKGQPQGIVEDELNYESIIKVKGLRNNSLLSIAPSGSIGTMLGISTGIEPVFRKTYMRKTESLHGKDVYYEVTHKAIKDVVDRIGDGEVPEYCIDTRDVEPIDKARVLGAFQESVDLSISNTTNMRPDITVEEIREFYVEAWKLGLKGVTVFVDGSIEGVLNDVEEEEEKPSCGG